MPLLHACVIFLIGLIGAADPPPAQSLQSRLLEEANSNYRALRSAEAVRLYREYLTTYTDRADVRTYLGAALLNLLRLPEALAEAKRAIALDGRYSKAYTLAGRIYTEMQQWEAATVCFDRAVTLDPVDRESWYFFGRSSYEAGRFGPAIDAFRQALRLGAEQSRVYENLGLAYEALGQFQHADQAYRHAIELPGSTYRSRLAYGVFLFKQGQTKDSLGLLEQAFRMEPNGPDVRFELGRTLYHAGQFSEAFEVLKGALLSDECRVHNLLARILAAEGKSLEAENEVTSLKTCRDERVPRVERGDKVQ